ncbi:Mitochondrial transcription termination factor family protein [Euphorbia peplus]|nr:Mitochondrial transcription termination factor family protein [Euphorbia peplus]
MKSSLILLKFPNFTHNIYLFSFSTSTPKISLFDHLVNIHQFSPECAANVSSSLSSTKFINRPQNADPFLNFLKENGFSKNQMEVVVRKVPRSLFADFETIIKPKFEVFQDLGFQSTDLARFISRYPWLLKSSADRLRISILGLKNVLGPSADICSLLLNFRHGTCLIHDFNATVVPNIKYLKSCGICSLQIASYVCNPPMFLVLKLEKLKGIVQRVDKMGVDRKSKMFIEAVKVMSNMSRENWELKLDVFRELGFSEHNILVAFRRMPSVFGSSEKKIKEVTQLLLSVEDISYIANTPVLLGYSVEKRLKPRLRVLKALQSKNLLKKIPSLSQFLNMSDAKFIEKYVNTFSNEVGGLYVASEDL